MNANDANADELTAEQAAEITEGDELTIRYESAYADRGNEQVVEATVERVEDELPNLDDGSILDLRVVTDDRDEHESDYEQAEADRRLKVATMNGDIVYVEFEGRNCGRWHSLVRAGHDAAVTVKDDERERVTVHHVAEDDYEFRHEVRFDDDALDREAFETHYRPAETVLDTTDPAEAYEAAQGGVVNREQGARHMVASAQVGDVFEVTHADGSTSWLVVEPFGFRELDLGDAEPPHEPPHNEPLGLR